jgi:restriction system protein
VQAQLSKWHEQETRKRQQKAKEAQRVVARQHAENLKSQAEEDTRAAQEALDTFREILAAGLHVSQRIDWDQLLDRRGCPPFQLSVPKPDRDRIHHQLLGPRPAETLIASPVPEKPSFLESFLTFLRTRRLQREAQAREAAEKERKQAPVEFLRRLKEYEAREKEVVEAYNSAVRAYNSKMRQEREKYIRQRDEFLAQQEGHNNSILAFRSRYEAASPDAVERYIQMALERSSYPEPISADPDPRFDEVSKTLIVNFWLPGPAGVPNTVEFKYVASRKAIKAVEMKQKDFEAFYDEVIHQIALRTIHEVFAADYAARVEAVVFNGWVSGIDPKTGKPFTSCVLSCEASRRQFMDLDLAHVSPKECIRGLKGISAGPLVMLAPVRPIMELKRDDDRFVESKAILDQLQLNDNLAGMEWEDFEHLGRELFEKEFSQTGGEVRVTQASRDRGVDAIAFDPDPIRGGKFVIQAKRYNMVVPVSAVRDLYGTMIAEGATKGILVTTSHYGRDSREFAKDKPITLIDGENLVHMFQKHGRNVHIAMLPKGDPRRGLGSAGG